MPPRRTFPASAIEVATKHGLIPPSRTLLDVSGVREDDVESVILMAVATLGLLLDEDMFESDPMNIGSNKLPKSAQSERRGS